MKGGSLSFIRKVKWKTLVTLSSPVLGFTTLEQYLYNSVRNNKTDLSRYPSSDVVVLGVADLEVEGKQLTNLYRGLEQDVVHVHAEGPGLAKHVGVGPGQLVSLPHDKSSEYLVVPVPVIRLANNQVLQFSIFKPDRILWLHRGLE